VKGGPPGEDWEVTDQRPTELGTKQTHPQWTARAREVDGLGYEAATLRGLPIRSSSIPPSRFPPSRCTLVAPPLRRVPRARTPISTTPP